jgi:hypothetical protein
MNLAAFAECDTGDAYVTVGAKQLSVATTYSLGTQKDVEELGADVHERIA